MTGKQDFVKEIASIDNDYSRWYTDVVTKTQLADYGPVKGTMVIRPYGYAIWELIQKELDARFKATGHENAYFPMLIPISYLKKEAEHVEGFAPEVATVTHIGNEELAEKLVIRPTSETIICEMMSKWIQSYRDLPLKLNQWSNVMRAEKTTRPFLRTSEFLWQEGHTAHATEEEAMEETLTMLNVYKEFCKNVLALPVLIGRKSEKEKFAGAVATYSMEAMMQDGKSLQAGTTHYLGTNFAKAFDVKYLDRDESHKYVHQSSWGVSTRLIGAIIMAHGDQRGLCLPPNVAPIQAVIIPIASQHAFVKEAAKKLFDELTATGIRVKLDDSPNKPGWKFNEYEMKGVPLRLELGPKDIESGIITVARRDTNEKTQIQNNNIATAIKNLLNEIHEKMYNKAEAFMNSKIKQSNNLDELVKNTENGFSIAMWCGERSCEEKIKGLYQVTTRNMPFDQTPINDKCVCCGKPAKVKVFFGKAY